MKYRTYKTERGAQRRQVELEAQYPEKLFDVSVTSYFRYVVVMACGPAENPRSRWAYCA